MPKFVDRECAIVKRPDKNQSVEMHLYTKGDSLMKEDARNRCVLRINDKKNDTKVLANIRVEHLEFIWRTTLIALQDWASGQKKVPLDLMASSSKENSVKFFSGTKFTDERNFHKCYQLNINYRPDREYPIWITCKNFWAPLQKTATGGTSIRVSDSDQNAQAQICLTMHEWVSMISKLIRVRNQWDTFRVVTGEVDEYFSTDYE